MFTFFGVQGKRTTRRKVKALLAGGLILGLGSAITLAAWSDSEFAGGTLSSGGFNLEGSANGTSYADHASGPQAASLSFSPGFDQLSPNSTVAAPYAVRLDQHTSFDATVRVASATSTGVGTAALSYGIVQLGSIVACTPTATGTTIVPAGTPLDSVLNASPFSLSGSTALGTAPGTSAFLCIQVTASPALAQGVTTISTWQFAAESSL